MTTGAPPPNYYFLSSKNILPHYTVQPQLYNAAGYVEHPLQKFGQVGGAGLHFAGPGDTIQPIFPDHGAGSQAAFAPPDAGSTGNGPGQMDYYIGHPYTINGLQPGRR